MDLPEWQLVQEELQRMSVSDLAKLQQTVLSNTDLLLNLSGLMSMSPEAVSRAVRAASQASPEEMRFALDMAARATPEELAAAMDRDRAEPAESEAALEALAAVCAARELKEQGDRLRRRGQFAAAAVKYEVARDSLLLTRSPPAAAMFPAAVREECALSLMSCYLRTGRFEECVGEGSAVLERDPGNVTACCRRGQAYRALGLLEEAVADLRRARVMCPEDETIAKDFGEVKEELRLANDATQSRRRKEDGVGGEVKDEIDDDDGARCQRCLRRVDDDVDGSGGFGESGEVDGRIETPGES